MPWLDFLQQPITQLVGLVALVVALQKMGIDVWGLARMVLSSKSTTDTIDFDNRNVMQQLLTQMETLSGHFNHETTQLLTEIRDTLKENFAIIHAKHDEWDRRGIPTADSKNK